MSFSRNIRKLFRKKPKQDTAEYFVQAILHETHSNEEWFRLKDSFETFCDQATTDEIAYIEESGANDCIYQLLEYLDCGD